MSIDIQIWSDIACPWCFIGKRRFERALAQFPQRDQVDVTWRSFQLDPSLPEHSDLDEIDYLVERKGMPRVAVEEMVAHVSAQADGEGLAYDFDHLVVANSRRAHRLLQAAKLADRQDSGTRAATLKEALLSAHFERGLDTGDPDTLVGLAVTAGLAEPTARAALDSDEMDAAVEADIALAAEIGVRGVPFFVVDNRYGVSGAQPSEVFLRALTTALAERKPSLVTLEGADEGEACGPDGCA